MPLKWKNSVVWSFSFLRIDFIQDFCFACKFKFSTSFWMLFLILESDIVEIIIYIFEIIRITTTIPISFRRLVMRICLHVLFASHILIFKHYQFFYINLCGLINIVEIHQVVLPKKKNRPFHAWKILFNDWPH